MWEVSTLWGTDHMRRRRDSNPRRPFDGPYLFSKEAHSTTLTRLQWQNDSIFPLKMRFWYNLETLKKLKNKLKQNEFYRKFGAHGPDK